ncbi:hypothetical protein IC007_0616 [Sulfuracidifex tepidarius]|uniref:Uncharacterized protein n=1 Tax=Sulfuracidifex tepidarius TaxID=1294262 RepID=A0A510E0U6_9CREN|nr:hypothetical protein IC007_0616 [Sulfuracidifex tepidarius]
MFREEALYQPEEGVRYPSGFSSLMLIHGWITANKRSWSDSGFFC